MFCLTSLILPCFKGLNTATGHLMVYLMAYLPAAFCSDGGESSHYLSQADYSGTGHIHAILPVWTAELIGCAGGKAE